VAQADRLALALDVATVAVVPRSGRAIGLELHGTDPLAEGFELESAAAKAAGTPLILGRTAEGADIRHPLAAPATSPCKARTAPESRCSATAFSAKRRTLPTF
jgi:hypothetical protein